MTISASWGVCPDQVALFFGGDCIGHGKTPSESESTVINEDPVEPEISDLPDIMGASDSEILLEPVTESTEPEEAETVSADEEEITEKETTEEQITEEQEDAEK